MFCRNIKTGKVYSVISFDVINSTNGIAGSLVMVLYKDNKGQYFVREGEEFHNKFVEVTGTNTGPSEMEEIVLGFMDNIKPKDTKAKEPTLQGKLEDLNMAFNHLKAEVDKRFEAVFNTIGNWKVGVKEDIYKPQAVEAAIEISHDYINRHKFLHNHPGLEERLGISEGHVIVDRNDWKAAQDIFNRHPNLIAGSGLPFTGIQFSKGTGNTDSIGNQLLTDSIHINVKEDEPDSNNGYFSNWAKMVKDNKVGDNEELINKAFLDGDASGELFRKEYQGSFDIGNEPDKQVSTTVCSCKVCGLLFIDSDDLYNHYDTVHNKGLE